MSECDLVSPMLIWSVALRIIYAGMMVQCGKKVEMGYQ